MRIAISGTHCMGKTTLIADLIKKYPHYKTEMEPYYHLQEMQTMELSLEPSMDSLIEQLDYSIKQLNDAKNKENIIFDRCPIDFIAYAMCIIKQDDMDIHESEISERFSEVTEALNYLDLIVFLPITKEHLIEYTEENPEYRSAADKCFKKIYRDDGLDIFPSYSHPKIIEIWGERAERVKKFESIL